MIVAAAIKINFLTLSMPKPARHHDILHAWYGLQVDVLQGFEPTSPYVEEIEGFIDNDGNFLNRSDAFIHVNICGQGLPKRNPYKEYYKGNELYSKDLW